MLKAIPSDKSFDSLASKITSKRTFSQRSNIIGQLSVIPSAIENGTDGSSTSHSIASHLCSSTFNGDFGDLTIKSFVCHRLSNNSD